MKLLDGKVAIITGGGRGVGRAVAKLFAAEGANVLIADNGSAPDGTGDNAKIADTVAKEIKEAGGSAVGCCADITDPDDSHGLIDTAVSNWDRMDILFNCAGNIRLGTLFDTTIEDWRAIMRVHLDGVFTMTQQAALHWRDRNSGGRLLNVTSIAVRGHTSYIAYTAAKGAIVSFTRACANELAKYKVTANAIAPIAGTRQVDSIRPEAQQALSQTGRLPHQDVEGTSADPAHVAPLVAFLASDAAARISGRVLSAEHGEYGLWAEQQDEIRKIAGASNRTDLYRKLDQDLTKDLNLSDLAETTPMTDWKSWNWSAPHEK